MTNYETKCGGKINVTHQGWSHLQAHPNVLEHLQEAISKIQLPAKPQKIEFEVDLGRIVGRQGIVETAVGMILMRQRCLLFVQIESRRRALPLLEF